MSKIALTGNASGTGTLTIAAPNTSTDRTLTLPDAAGTMMLTNTNVTTAQMPAGSVLQVVQNEQTIARFSTTSTSFQNTGFFVNITPTSTSNKILVLANWFGFINGANYIYATIFRDSTDLAADWSSTEGLGLSGYNTVGGLWQPFVYSVLDAPATTSQVTYKLYGRSGNASLTATFGRNSSSGTKNQVNIVAMEIAA